MCVHTHTHTHTHTQHTYTQHAQNGGSTAKEVTLLHQCPGTVTLRTLQKETESTR